MGLSAYEDANRCYNNEIFDVAFNTYIQARDYFIEAKAWVPNDKEDFLEEIKTELFSDILQVEKSIGKKCVKK